MNTKSLLPILVFVLGRATPAQPQTSAQPQPQTPYQISVNDPRPLWKAVRALEERNGWQISYEDRLYTGADVVDSTAATYTGPGRSLLPRGGALQVSLSGSEPPATAVQMLVDAWVHASPTTQFAARSIGGMVVVAPPQGSPLDLPISLPQKQRDTNALLVDLAHAVGQAASIQVLGPQLINTQVQTSSAVTNQMARDVLLGALTAEAASDPRHPLFVWDFLCDGTGCALNVHAVRQRVPVPDGSSTKFVQVSSQ
ncbi:MAG TPA: hypothetical protein VMA31_12640 [Bryobacteraceae bacterium]|nr:hypothetical protein [Bryobacteraceae bacterium]